MSVDSSPDNAENSPARSPSRQHKTNRAGAENPLQHPSDADVTSRTGTKLRKEALQTDSDGSITATTWGDLRTEWRAWYLDTESSKLVFEDDRGDLRRGDHVHSFSQKYQERQCARAHQLESRLREKWGSMISTTMLTLTGSTTDDAGKPRSPADHQREVLSSWDSVRRELERVLEGRDWHRLGILEPHKSGHTHAHVAVFTKGPVVEEQFESVIEAHLRNCDIAEREAHEDAITVKRGDRSLQSIGSYLTAYMVPNYGDSALETPEYVQRWYALQWATPSQRFRPSQGAQELMEREEEDSQENASLWRFVGIAPDGDLDDVRECAPGPRDIWGETRPPPSRASGPPD